MSKKKVLFISFWLPPFNSPQSIQIGRILKYLKKYGDLEIHVVTAEICGKPIDPTLYPDILSDLKNVIKIKYRYNLAYELIKYHLLPTIYRMPDPTRWWSKRALKEIKRKYSSNYFDIILTFSFPLSLNMLGLWLRDYFKCPWIAHQSDPWNDNVFLNNKHLVKIYNERIERECFTSADMLIYISDALLKFYRNKYPEVADRMEYLPHSYDMELFKNLESIRENKKNRTKKIFRFIGNFYGTRTPEPILESISNLPKDYSDKMIFEMVGGGVKIPIYLKKYPNISNIVRHVGNVNYGKALEYMVDADVLFTIDAPVSGAFTESIFFPSKLVDYLASLTPVLGMAPHGSSRRVLEEFGYPCHDLTDISGMTESIMKFIDEKYTFDIRNNPNLKKYDILENIKIFRRWIDSLT